MPWPRPPRATRRRLQKEDKTRGAEERRGEEGRREKAGDECRYVLRVEVSLDWAGRGVGTSDVDCGESEEDTSSMWAWRQAACGRPSMMERHGLRYLMAKDRIRSAGWNSIRMTPQSSGWARARANSQRSVSYGDGIYRSDDGGKSWKNLGLKKSEHIGRVVVDPRDSKVVYVAAAGPLWGGGGDRGLYKTTDAGKTWKAAAHHQREHRRE